MKKNAAEPGGSETVVCRNPVSIPTPIGGDDATVTGLCSGAPSRIGGS